MASLLEIAKEKLDKKLQMPVTKGWSILPQLMLAVFNEETMHDLDLNMNDRQEMEQEIIALLYYSDKTVARMLELNSPEREEEIALKLDIARTESEIREILIVDLLFEAMRENLDDFPFHNRVGI
jgi:hypothetical protein